MTFIGSYIVSDVKWVYGYSRIRILVDSPLASILYNGQETILSNSSEKIISRIVAVRIIDYVRWQTYLGFFGWVTNHALTIVMGDGNDLNFRSADFDQFVLAPIWVP